MPKSAAARVSLILCTLATLGLLVVVVWHLVQERTGGTGEALVGGPFTLTDQNGQRRSDADFRGRYMLVYFGYSFCPDICPTELAAMSAALDKLGPAGDAVTPIFITIDPARDTVEQLKAYAANFHPRLVALTGSAGEIAAATKAYRVYAARGEGGDKDYLMDHSGIVYLMGPDGRFLAHFPPGTAPDSYAETIRSYLKG